MTRRAVSYNSPFAPLPNLPMPACRLLPIQFALHRFGRACRSWSGPSGATCEAPPGAVTAGGAVQDRHDDRPVLMQESGLRLRRVWWVNRIEVLEQ